MVIVYLNQDHNKFNSGWKSLWETKQLGVHNYQYGVWAVYSVFYYGLKLGHFVKDFDSVYPVDFKTKTLTCCNVGGLFPTGFFLLSNPFLWFWCKFVAFIVYSRYEYILLYQLVDWMMLPTKPPAINGGWISTKITTMPFSS